MKNASSHGMLRVLWRSLLEMLMTPRNHVDADDEPPFARAAIKKRAWQLRDHHTHLRRRSTAAGRA
eukprot:204490-Chlamydomonas_euryale.AAC.1